MSSFTVVLAVGFISEHFEWKRFWIVSSKQLENLVLCLPGIARARLYKLVLTGDPKWLSKCSYKTQLNSFIDVCKLSCFRRQ